MQIRFAEVTSHGAPLIVAIVPSIFTTSQAGPGMISRIQVHMTSMPIMLVSIEDNGPRAYAPFETHVLLALIQLENLNFAVVDLNATVSAEELPF